MSSFTTIPILSLAAAREPGTKPRFLADLRDALLNVGFCYLSDTGLPRELIEEVRRQTFMFFDEGFMPTWQKEAIEMKNEKSFLGWSRVSLLLSKHSPMSIYTVRKVSELLMNVPIARWMIVYRQDSRCKCCC